MTRLETFRDWLCSFPGWEGGLPVDHLEPVPGSNGLYCAGEEELSRKQDLLGNVTVRCRCRFDLYRVTPNDGDNILAANWLLWLQQWIRTQSALGLAPRVGDDPAAERIWGEKGHLDSARQTGTGKYQVTVWVEYTKIYQV